MNSTKYTIWHITPLLACISALIVTGCSLTSTIPESITRFSPCTASGSAFGAQDFDQWADYYHATVTAVTEEHLRAIQRTEELDLTCTAHAYEDVLRPSSALREVAYNLPAWRDYALQGELSETHAPAVLLELLRVYECSMKEKIHNAALTKPDTATKVLMQGAQLNAALKERQIIDKELSIARPALERTLQLLSGYDRLHPLSVNIECLKRSSLDLRNVLGLAAETSACLPRIMDAHGSLRDSPL